MKKMTFFLSLGATVIISQAALKADANYCCDIFSNTEMYCTKPCWDLYNQSCFSTNIQCSYGQKNMGKIDSRKVRIGTKEEFEKLKKKK